ncbi:hypothetical protein EX30DRAFT_338145 [Ascodesmis nigricans]|uniref:Uncharacterized protein n=1 Tax=Ascodesmis nigricans TaxID=341454 RepID=A0A4S2N2Z6_9PEZI|nr:hypothetical protein EX30DRAFT_338145 [Ascodesmis nigricans]
MRVFHPSASPTLQPSPSISPSTMLIFIYVYAICRAIYAIHTATTGRMKSTWEEKLADAVLFQGMVRARGGGGG